MTTQNDIHEGARAALGMATAASAPHDVDPETVVSLIDGVEVDAIVAGAASEVAERDCVLTASVPQAIDVRAKGRP